MKVHFASTKERSPDLEQGLKVLYGPSRRVAYRLRWYLILLLVASPLLWVGGRLVLAALQRRAPAQLVLATTELRAPDGGTVERVLVQTGQRVQAGQLLVQLDNPQWHLRLEQLRPAIAAGPDRLGRSALALQGESVGLQGQMVDLFRSLHHQGCLSSAELLAAEVQLKVFQVGLLVLQRRLRQERYQVEGDPIATLREERERAWLQARLGELGLRAPRGGRVMEVLVSPGESVGPGSLLLRLERPDPPRLWIYLRPDQAGWTEPNRSVEVQMPNGDWRPAQVLAPADLARRLPAGLAAPLGSEGLTLQVPARFLEPLPVEWQVDQLPLRVRFPQGWSWSWPWNWPWNWP